MHNEHGGGQPNRARLHLLDPALEARLRTASPVQLRRVVMQVCRFALERTGLSNPVLSEAVRSDITDDERAELNRSVAELAASLDEAAFVAQEKIENNPAAYRSYLSAFAQARAASAVAFALDKDHPVQAALEAVYEANAATHDLPGLRTLIAEALSPQADAHAAGSAPE